MSIPSFTRSKIPFSVRRRRRRCCRRQPDRTRFTADDDTDVDLLAFPINVIACTLKKFLRELPDALIPNAFQQRFMRAMDAIESVFFACSSKPDEYDRLLVLQSLINALPLANASLLKELIAMASTLSQERCRNGLDFRSLGSVFGTIVLRPEMRLQTTTHPTTTTMTTTTYDPEQDEHELIVADSCVGFMIRFYAELFERNPHREISSIMEETEILQRSYRIQLDALDKLQRDHDAVTNKTAREFFCRRLVLRTFCSWRSVSSTSTHRQLVFRKIERLRSQLASETNEKVELERRCTQLIERIELEDFDSKLSMLIHDSGRQDSLDVLRKVRMTLLDSSRHFDFLSPPARIDAERRQTPSHVRLGSLTTPQSNSYPHKFAF